MYFDDYDRSARRAAKNEAFYSTLHETAAQGALESWGVVSGWEKRNSRYRIRPRIFFPFSVEIKSDSFNESDLHPSQAWRSVSKEGQPDRFFILVTEDTIRRGWRRYTRNPSVWHDAGRRMVELRRTRRFRNEDIDAIMADRAVQLGAFRRVMFD
ncbi:hypothetical protein [Microbacterium sp. NPDC055455]